MAMAILGTFFLVVGSMCAHYYHGCVWERARAWL
jgi:hypothetical protein